ncbi:MAG: hypothetical protein NW216_05240 [Hyphomicrobium sp.]|nr:hypothetical protein [Hyphomicrobium sp.]
MKFRQVSANVSQPERMRVLIVEPDGTDAMALEDILFDAGYLTIGPVPNFAEASRKLGLVRIDMAVVDMDAPRDEVEAIVGAIAEKNLPCVLVGSAWRLKAWSSFAPHLPRVQKPVSGGQLLSVLASASGEYKRISFMD